MQEFPLPQIKFRTIPTTNNTLYLDHPERISIYAFNTSQLFTPSPTIDIEKSLEEFNEGSSNLSTENIHFSFGKAMSKEEVRTYLKRHNEESLAQERWNKSFEETRKKQFKEIDYDKIPLDSYKNFNQGTDFFVINEKWYPLEKLI